MTSRDDIVFRPSIGPNPVAAARVRAREERDIRRAGGKRGLFGKLARRAALKKARRRRALERSRAKARAAAGRGARGVGGVAARGAARGLAARGAGRAAATPIGAVVTGIAVAVITATRLIQGKPLENMGNELEKMLLGDYPDEARATMATRRQMQGDEHLLRIAGLEGGQPNSQITSIFEDLKKINKRHEVGKTALRREFPANNALDMLILRARDKWVEIWNSEGMTSKAENIREKIGDIHVKKGRGSGR